MTEYRRDEMRIGELAARFDLNPKTIRYYEEIGLLPAAARSAAGYRRYTTQDAERLVFIRRAKALDLSLDEIRDILALRQRGEVPCGQVLGVIDDKLREIDARIEQLQTFRADVMRLRADWSDWAKQEGVRGPLAEQICPIIEQQDEVRAHPASRRLGRVTR